MMARISKKNLDKRLQGPTDRGNGGENARGDVNGYLDQDNPRGGMARG
jgi:hypothetical protein